MLTLDVREIRPARREMGVRPASPNLPDPLDEEIAPPSEQTLDEGDEPRDDKEDEQRVAVRPVVEDPDPGGRQPDEGVLDVLGEHEGRERDREDDDPRPHDPADEAAEITLTNIHPVRTESSGKADEGHGSGDRRSDEDRREQRHHDDGRGPLIAVTGPRKDDTVRGSVAGEEDEVVGEDEGDEGEDAEPRPIAPPSRKHGRHCTRSVLIAQAFALSPLRRRARPGSAATTRSSRAA